MGKLRRPKRHRKRNLASRAIATAARKKEVDLKPEDCDTQPLPRKLRLLMDTSTQTSNKHKAATTTSPNPAVLDIKGSDVIKDEIHATHVQKKLPSVHTASAARKRHLKQWKEKHKRRRQRKEDVSLYDNGNDKVSFGEVVRRPPELSGRRVKLKHLTFIQGRNQARDSICHISLT
ncbi:coiled-coil domain-containing protein 137-like [Dysidea avara]|uniref:coiled-coil domain-containing protein 137-like n=1 Tax=Dysidea avara TaxID=196820 RepID=UPI003318FDCA